MAQPRKKLNPNDAFGELKEALNDYDIESVASAADVHVTTLYHWLDGRTTGPRITTMQKVAKAIGYKIVLHLTAKGSVKPKRHLRLV